MKAGLRIKKIKKLLKAGHTKTAIARSLSISRYQMEKLMKQLVASNMKSSKRISKLSSHEMIIRQWVGEGKRIKTIQQKLASMQVPVHYSTITKYIQGLSNPQEYQTILNPPGEVAYISVLRIQRAKDNYLFCLMFGYSHYSYFSLLKSSNVSHFLKCHADCFNLLGGVPKFLRICDISNLYLSTKDEGCYQNFLTHYGIRMENGLLPLRNNHLCKIHSQRAQKDILSNFFDSNVRRLASTLKSKHAPSFNLCIHPATQKPIYKEFELNEKPVLLPLPLYSSKIQISVTRKVSVRGRIFYRYNQYQMPAIYKGKMVIVQEISKELLFTCEGKIIAAYPCIKSSKKLFLKVNQIKKSVTNEKPYQTKADCQPIP